MQWWAWLAIWGGLGLLLIAMLIVFAVILFRKVVRVFDGLEQLASTTEVLERAGDVAEEQRAELAILLGRAKVASQRERVRSASAARRRDRHDARILRAKALTKVDASSRQWFTTD